MQFRVRRLRDFMQLIIYTNKHPLMGCLCRVLFRRERMFFMFRGVYSFYFTSAPVAV